MCAGCSAAKAAVPECGASSHHRHNVHPERLDGPIGATRMARESLGAAGPSDMSPKGFTPVDVLTARVAEPLGKPALLRGG